MFKYIIILYLVLLSITTNSANALETLNIYNWSDYINPGTLKDFEQKYNVKINYDVFDSDYMLESKLNLDKVSYDILVPSAFPFLARQIKTGIYQELDLSKIKNYKNLNHKIMKMMSTGGVQKYAIPWMWGTVGIGYNKVKIAKLAPDLKIDDVNVIFDIAHLKKIASCGVEIIDIHNEVIPAALVYLGLNPNSEKEEDLHKVKELFKKIRPYIRAFHASKYIEDLASGEVCLVFGFSGDILQASKRAKENKLPVNIEYVIPKSGTQLWIDALAIPKGAKNIENAYKFIDFLLEPSVTAENTNYINFANANLLAGSYVKPSIIKHKGIYPDLDKLKLYVLKPISDSSEKKRAKIWLEFTANAFN